MVWSTDGDRQRSDQQHSAASGRTSVRRCWSIGVYEVASPPAGEHEPAGVPLVLTPAAGVQNPVLTAAQVSDVEAAFVADPFMIAWQGGCYLFFEVWNGTADRGEIAYATSDDGLSWSYRGVVLREPFHLSYPCVFPSGQDLYMIPETRQARAVRLYRAVDFPRRWAFVKELIRGDLADATPFFHDRRWWLLAQRGLDELRLYSAPELTDGWNEHPASPIVAGNRRLSRPGGKVIRHHGRLLRLAQDAWPTYGSRLRAVAIDCLSGGEYAEHEVAESPVLAGSGTGWNAVGMHHADIHGHNELPFPSAGPALAYVDGFRMHDPRPREQA